MDRKYCDICGCEITELPYIVETRHDDKITTRLECCFRCKDLLYNIICSVSSFKTKG